MTATYSFYFDDDDKDIEYAEFDIDTDLDVTADDHADDIGAAGWDLESVNDESDYDLPFSKFNDWNDYIQYREDVDNHGSAAEVRYEDVGSFDEDQYCGAFDSQGEYARQYADDCGDDIPSWVESHVDWDSAADELLMDHSTYDVGGQTHIFRDY